ncbi:Pleckstrin homology-like domain [Ceraceosorus bombacis]|uniref:Pleckstrin homology-like domain n=2 Tax=Ceraceosorus TaxID=401624 RepID=A0A0P1BGR2_9BASI|nr:Pleckstrin homology-like domain [Ceraceosorus bombacis]
MAFAQPPQQFSAGGADAQDMVRKGSEARRNSSPAARQEAASGPANMSSLHQSEDVGGWARRTANNVVMTERERSRLLRTVSTLDKTQGSPAAANPTHADRRSGEAASRSNGSEGTETPPCYETALGADYNVDSLSKGKAKAAMLRAISIPNIARAVQGKLISPTSAASPSSATSTRAAQNSARASTSFSIDAGPSTPTSPQQSSRSSRHVRSTSSGLPLHPLAVSAAALPQPNVTFSLPSSPTRRRSSAEAAATSATPIDGASEEGQIATTQSVYASCAPDDRTPTRPSTEQSRVISSAPSTSRRSADETILAPRGAGSSNGQISTSALLSSTTPFHSNSVTPPQTDATDSATPDLDADPAEMSHSSRRPSLLELVAGRKAEQVHVAPNYASLKPALGSSALRGDAHVKSNVAVINSVPSRLPTSAAVGSPELLHTPGAAQIDPSDLDGDEAEMERLSSPTDYHASDQTIASGNSPHASRSRSSFSFLRSFDRRTSSEVSTAPQRRGSAASWFGRSRDNLQTALEDGSDAEGGPCSSTPRRASVASVKGIFRKKGSKVKDGQSARSSGSSSPRYTEPQSAFHVPFALGDLSGQASPTLEQTEEAARAFSTPFGMPVRTRNVSAQSTFVTPSMHAHTRAQREDEGPLGERRPSLAPSGSRDARSGIITGMPATVASPATSPSDRASALSGSTDHTSVSTHAAASRCAGSSPNGGRLISAESSRVGVFDKVAVDSRQLLGSALSVADEQTALHEQRPTALGVDQEQAALDARSGQDPNISSSGGEVTAQGATYRASSGESPTTSTPARQPAGRGRLSHLPRLDSMRLNRNTQSNGSGNGSAPPDGGAGGDGNDDGRRQSQEGGDAGDDSEDDSEDDHAPSGSEAEETEEAESETDAEDESDHERSPSPAMPGSMPITAATLARVSPPAGIALPPAQRFDQTLANSISRDAQSVDNSNRQSWTRFAEFPPLETPRTLTGRTPISSTPLARALNAVTTNDSYFAQRPAQPRLATGARPPTGSDVPPPSPSIISRSRAPSSASVRTTRSGHSAVVGTPSRDTSALPSVNGATHPLSSTPRAKDPAHPANGPSYPHSSTPKPRDHSPGQRYPLSSTPRARQPSTGHQSSHPTTAIALGTGAPASRTGADGQPASIRSTSFRRPLTASGSSASLSIPVGLAKKPDPGREASPASRNVGTPTSPRANAFASVGPSASATGASRPGLYSQKSQSLVDLSASSRREAIRPTQPPSFPASPGLFTGRASPSPSQQGGATLAPPAFQGKDAPDAQGMRRRQSMFEVGKEPPPYSIIHERPEGKQLIMPREEEGKESLPSYFCGVHIEGYLPRKMEFSAPGVQAKDRSWRRYYFVLHGTSLKLFKTDLSAAGYASKGAWGEMDGAHVHKEPMNEVAPAAGQNGSSAPNGDEKRISNGTSSAMNERSTSGVHGTSGLNHAVELVINNRPFGSQHAISSASASASDLSKHNAVRNYTLQNAESGLAADYLKRRHVVRVRVEGEQFLLQTRNDRHVVEWIEAFQASTNVALDLDSRVLPKFITLPRRRRRRRAQEGTAVDERAREAAQIAEAQRRSVTDAVGGGPATRGRASPPRPLGLPQAGDRGSREQQDTSDALEAMLAEEHRDMARRDASEIIPLFPNETPGARAWYLHDASRT